MSVAARLRDLLNRYDPTSLGLLGLLAIPGYVFESLSFLTIFGIFFLFFLWMLVGPIVDALLGWWIDADEMDRGDPRDWLEGSWKEAATFFLMLPVTFVNPLALAGDALQLAGIVAANVRHRVSVPAPDSYDQRRSYRLPVEGTWTVVNGSPDREHSHSWFYVNQRYAYDFVVTDDDGRTRPEGAPADVENYYCYEKPVVAPADGVVVDALDTDAELSRAGGLSHPLKREIAGNYVVVQHAPDEYSTLAHLQPGSVCVEPGERVERGQRLGQCGHSGVSSEPHLHFQFQDHPTFEIAAGLPISFDDVVIDAPVEAARPEHVAAGSAVGDEREADTNGDTAGRPAGQHADGQWFSNSYVSAGQRVTHESPPDGDGNETADTGIGDATPASAPGRSVAVARRAAFGLAVAGVVAFFGNVVGSWTLALGVLVAGSLLGVAYRYGYAALADQSHQYRRGTFGSALGLAGGAVVVWLAATTDIAAGIDTAWQPLGLAGAVLYVLVGEYDRLSLRSDFGDADPVGG